MFSIVIPLYNEEGSLRTLVEEIDRVRQQNSYELEVVFVDDGGPAEGENAGPEARGGELDHRDGARGREGERGGEGGEH